ncbi:Gfo/Idh/MocA family protein [Calycomorphotria hydatis]|uniref:Inositol 2-dehydrogenase/D-chiro-inositol 3-dehydrogenase n=1 Tax=Calycomorphotria hydatis TaxID=2528027 RepID=A0A517T5T3_9PLAN|nr:Gfo/Idh/MocA family oxidoreductase [Calycomorphotria hydatis]QDT63742.1 Inositol 2-dehydrogenase/D-chiro-inositol 3-dehydrogenase [Calycomorphotria hydatis]
MSEQQPGIDRRDLLKVTGTVAAGLATGVSLPKAFAAEDSTIQVALVGCGGRGSGAMMNCFNSEVAPTKLVAMADVFQHRLDNSYNAITKARPDHVDVPDEKKFIGFDAYRQAMDCLRPGDVVILATPPAFRWVHFTYAIERGLNVFMEKPVTVDGPTSRRMLELNEKAQAKNLKVGVGLMTRHATSRKELHERVQNGEIGDLMMIRGYRQFGPGPHCFSKPKPEGEHETLWQIKRFHSFLWIGGGSFSDYSIHHVDEACWMKNAWPVKAEAAGGRHYRNGCVDQNFDAYSIEYTFDDGTKFFYDQRNMPGAKNEFATYLHGTTGCAVSTARGHTLQQTRTYSGQNFDKKNLIWSFPKGRVRGAYDLEWDDLLSAIVNNESYNEVEHGVYASLVTSMGRMAAHTAQEITFDQLLNGDHEFAPGLDKITMESPAPLVADAEGMYPIPEPGIKTKREF